MDDLISRQAAIMDAESWVAVDEYEKHLQKNVVEWLKEFPPAEAEQRTGHWHITDAYPHNVYCSECHKRFAQTHWAIWEDGSLPRNFCPNCGAKMKQLDKTCDCYSDGRCVGTKEIDSCSCGGNKSKCDFYENVRREGETE